MDGAAPYLTKILQSSGRMKSIINNILGYSKLSADHATFEAVDFKELINDIVEDLEVAITEKKAKIVAGQFPLIECIPAQIRQVFQNILGNALKFSKPETPPYIEISAERVADLAFGAKKSKDGDFCRITVKDNGIGFNEKFAHNIFLLFQRLHSKDAYEGTGIGLAIAKKIIEKHMGLISAHGKENHGATFVIVLPLKQHQTVAEVKSNYAEQR
jgi:two-component system, chemotaxis family, CheB/CheR fusion protein